MIDAIRVIVIVMLIFSILLLISMFLVLKDVKQRFICKKCKKVNDILAKKCQHCKASMPKGTIYKTLLFGKRNYLDPDGNIIRKKELKWIHIDILICISILIILVAILIATFI